MHYLVETDSVDATAAASDYLEERASAGDEVTVVAVASPEIRPRGGTARGAERRARPSEGRRSTRNRTSGGRTRRGTLETARERGSDEMVIAARSGRSDSAVEVGSTARSIVAGADRSVVVVPHPEL